MINAPFDIVAPVYDLTFTHTVIGKLQRDAVYRNVMLHLNPETTHNILEINCGTGEDAVWLSRQGYRVTATDISEQMIRTAQQKDTTGAIAFQQADINSLPTVFPDRSFDMIFSDFGGLNCLSPTELTAFFENADQLLKSNGQLLLVIMPKNTLWEHVYFLAKGKWSSIFRRQQQNVKANLDGESVITYYYNPKEIEQMAQRYFAVTRVRPIGFFIPPSYLEPFLKNKKYLTAILEFLENTIRNIRFLSRYSDHYFIVLQKR